MMVEVDKIRRNAQKQKRTVCNLLPFKTLVGFFGIGRGYHCRPDTVEDLCGRIIQETHLLAWSLHVACYEDKMPNKGQVL